MPNLYRAGVLEWIWLGAGLACLSAAGWAAAGRRFPAERRGAARAALGVGVPLLFAWFKLAQFRAHESMLDSAVMINLAWNAAHGHGLTSSLLGGVSYWSVHFAFAYALLSPILLVWSSPTPFFLLHGLALGSVPLCAYFLARRGRAELGWIAAALVAGHPFVCGILGTVLDNSSFALPLFLWAAYCWETGRRRSAVILAVLMLSTRETIPFLFAGLGAYAWATDRDAAGRRRGAALIAASAAVWLLEMRVIESAKAASGVVFDYWSLYPSLGGARDAVVGNLLRRPWLIPAALVWPPVKIWHVAKVLLSLALLPLASGAALLPLALIWLPQQMGDAASNYHLLIGHQASYVAGPAIWAAIVGLRRLDARLDARGRDRLAAWVLVIAALGFFTTAQFRLPPGSLPSSWEATGPRAVAAVPAGDAVWCDTFFASHLAARRFIKVLPLGDDPVFDAGRFEPDSVLLSRHWLARASPATVARVLQTIKARGLVPVFDENDLVVFSGLKTH